MFKVPVRVASKDQWIAQLPAGLRREYSLEELEQMKQQFCDFDESGDGSISASELAVLMKSMGFDAKESELQLLIDKVDDNHSGALEFPEFVRLVSDFRRGHGDKLASFLQYSKVALKIRHELDELLQEPTKYSVPAGVKENAWEWKICVRGPPSTPYEGGTFVFCCLFDYEYPYQPPTLTCRTKIYHPNFVPMMNGTFEIYRFFDEYTPEWRMRGCLERLERLFEFPDVALLDKFQEDTAAQQNAFVARRESMQTKAKEQQNPMGPSRRFAMECVELFVEDEVKFNQIASDFTRRFAHG